MTQVLKRGDMGAAVRELQKLLRIDEDGWFDAETERAVLLLQRGHRLLADGVMGPNSWAALRGAANERVLIMDDLEAAAEKLQVPIHAVMAVAEVESAGSGFMRDGRPVILFERHIFARQLSKRGVDVPSLVKKFPNLVNTARGGYTGGQAGEWSRLQSARGIPVAGAADAANESASWGRFQIMGFHWEHLGYASITDFVEAMSSTEGQQLDAFVRFVMADDSMWKALRGRKWANFAREYNGPAYRENMYDVKLQRAYEKHERFMAEDAA